MPPQPSMLQVYILSSRGTLSLSPLPPPIYHRLHLHPPSLSPASSCFDLIEILVGAMALEAVVFPPDPFACNLKEQCGYEYWSSLLLEGDCFNDQGVGVEEWGVGNNLLPVETVNGSDIGRGGGGKKVEERKKRRRARSCKNKEEAENQRMTHIAVERNRRKLMNEYLGSLRSIMPPAYVQRGDQASIVGGAINFVKELEQLLQTLEAQKRSKLGQNTGEASSSPFADFFTFPQYSSSNSNNNAPGNIAKNQSAVADIEVTMVESHANLKVLSSRRPKQLLRIVAGLQNLRFTVLHVNVTTVDQMVLYSFSLKVEDDCQFTVVDDIATAVHQMIEEIQEETTSSACN